MSIGIFFWSNLELKVQWFPKRTEVQRTWQKRGNHGTNRHSTQYRGYIIGEGVPYLSNMREVTRDPISFGDQKSIYYDIRRHWQIDRRGPLTQIFKYKYKYKLMSTNHPWIFIKGSVDSDAWPFPVSRSLEGDIWLVLRQGVEDAFTGRRWIIFQNSYMSHVVVVHMLLLCVSSCSQWVSSRS